MGRVSQRYIEPEIESRIFEVFRNYIANITYPQEVEEFFTSLLSHTEQIMVAKRLAIAVLLYKGYTYERINDTLKVSSSTVTTVHKQIISGATGYRKAVDKILSEENKELLGLNIEEFLMQISLPKAHGSQMWKEKSKKGKKITRRQKELSGL
jgi:uncharacterized protein YerC